VEYTHSGNGGQSRGRLGEIIELGKKESKGKTQGVNRTNTAINYYQSHNWKNMLETWEDVDLGRDNGSRRDHGCENGLR